MYAITNAFDIRDSIKAAGGTYDATRKAWIVTDAVYAKLAARSSSFGMGWTRGWAKAVATKIEAASNWQTDPRFGYAEG